ncbi:MAG: ribosome maturation factor RimP [Alphaproteobacteria bacterium]|nr:ribosome maturation factor RimP [Alphaproteobacteria bacterium]
MLLEEKIAMLIEPVLEPIEFRLVRVNFASGVLQIMAEPFDADREMTVEDCAKISRGVSAVLDVEDPIKSAYQLEVSSPGLSRPLVRPEDYTRFAGELAKISTRNLIDNRRRFNGRLTGLDENDNVLMDTAFGPVSIPFDAIESAKLDPSEWFLKPLKSRKKG